MGNETGSGKKRMIAFAGAAFAAGIIIGAAAFFAVSHGVLGAVSVPKQEYEQMISTYERFGKLELIYESIERNYYKDIDEEALVTGAEKGLVDALGDPYSSYMTKEEYESWEASALGEYEGVGITFSEDEDGNFVVVGVTGDSPAERAGIKAGDLIVSVDGKTFEDMDAMAQSIRGEEGSSVKVVYSRNGSKKEVEMKREKIEQESVEYRMLDSDTGYIRLTSFLSGSYDDFSAAMDELEKKGARDLILDIRDNGGGLVNTCIEIADEFLDEGVVTYVEDRAGKRMEYTAEDGKTDMRTVVLTNENSASCSEILAAAMQDNGYEIIGEKTFGKGVIQTTSQLEDGSALKLTIMQYFSPEGKEIQGKGVTPDISVTDDESTETDEQLERAMKALD